MSGPLTLVEASELGPRAQEWDALVERAPLPTPFLRSWWLDVLTAQDSLYLLVTDSDRLVGGVALQRPRGPLGRYRLLGDGVLCPDHLDLLAAPERVDDVVATLRAWLSTTRGLFDLRGVREDSLLTRALPSAETSPLTVAPYEPLTGGYESWSDRRGTSFNRRSRRTVRTLAKRGVTCRRVGVDEVPAALDDFEAMHRARSDRAPLMRRWRDLRALVLAGAERDEAWVFSADGPDGRLAVLVTFACGGRLSIYQAARWMDRSASGAGVALNLEAIRCAAEAGLQEIDLLRGDEAYKYDLSEHERTLQRLQAAHGRLAGMLKLAASTWETLRRTGGRLRRAWTRA